jgi:hypothetical protein
MNSSSRSGSGSTAIVCQRMFWSAFGLCLKLGEKRALSNSVSYASTGAKTLALRREAADTTAAMAS